jgi:hypothetical protein
MIKVRSSTGVGKIQSSLNPKLVESAIGKELAVVYELVKNWTGTWGMTGEGQVSISLAVGGGTVDVFSDAVKVAYFSYSPQESDSYYFHNITTNEGMASQSPYSLVQMAERDLFGMFAKINSSAKSGKRLRLVDALDYLRKQGDRLDLHPNGNDYIVNGNAKAPWDVETIVRVAEEMMFDTTGEWSAVES